jgi:hypothetical protein
MNLIRRKERLGSSFLLQLSTHTTPLYATWITVGTTEYRSSSIEISNATMSVSKVTPAICAQRLPTNTPVKMMTTPMAEVGTNTMRLTESVCNKIHDKQTFCILL